MIGCGEVYDQVVRRGKNAEELRAATERALWCLTHD